MKEAGIDFKNLILDNIREGIILLDSESNFVFMNQEAENIIGISSQRFKKDNDIKSILSKDQIAIFERLSKRKKMIGKRNY